ncbi:hypothetical protein H4S08_002408 [Coemansia sp. RSA 1365]|nr:hypothetical protein H4S08_002408 [Coemansia sp. RSA 1365]
MGPKAGNVVVGLYPQHMGKSTFLDTLGSFLDIIGSFPYDKRKEVFQKCAVYDKNNRQFFNENFAKYPVLRLNFKTALPKTDYIAIQELRNIAIEAAEPYVKLLQDLIHGKVRDDIGELDLSKVCRFERGIQKFLIFHRDLKKTDDPSIYGSSIEYLLPMLMKLLYDIFNVPSVVLVDEFDVPYMSTFYNKNIDHNMRACIHDTYTGFLSAMLKVRGLHAISDYLYIPYAIY